MTETNQDMAKEDILLRKMDHIEIGLTKDVSMHQETGFTQYQFVHRALPELALEDISVETTFLGHAIGAPILISGMTGGNASSLIINRNLAVAAQALRIPMSVGSQRIMFEHPESKASFAVVREVAPDVPIFGNLGAVQLNYGLGRDNVEQAVDLIRGDGIFLHLNPLQEVIQRGGNTNFSGLLQKISSLIQDISIPVLVKEVGCGISPPVACSLADAGVAAIDVSGAGGTSWAWIEALRTEDPQTRRLGEVFHDWGIPTSHSIKACRNALPDLPLIASGGIRTGLDIAKAVVLGADLCGLAMPLLAAATHSSTEVIEVVNQFILELRVAMFLIGVPSISALQNSQHLLRESF